jgi:NADH:ubiquinone oxidoreductase subunit F (NADH-binding)
MNPEGVLEEIKKSKLRGRGGGGFPMDANGNQPAKQKANPNTSS